jgi:hypothetical protein
MAFFKFAPPESVEKLLGTVRADAKKSRRGKFPGG